MTIPSKEGDIDVHIGPVLLRCRKEIIQGGIEHNRTEYSIIHYKGGKEDPTFIPEAMYQAMIAFQEEKDIGCIEKQILMLEAKLDVLKEKYND